MRQRCFLLHQINVIIILKLLRKIFEENLKVQSFKIIIFFLDMWDSVWTDWNPCFNLYICWERPHNYRWWPWKIGSGKKCQIKSKYDFVISKRGTIPPLFYYFPDRNLSIGIFYLQFNQINPAFEYKMS